jgi:hypothetical protein
MSDRRGLPREALVAAVVCRVGNDTFQARVRNISPRGAFLETKYLFDPTHEIRMAIDLPGRGTIAATGRTTRFVAGGDCTVGVGVQFLEGDAH